MKIRETIHKTFFYLLTCICKKESMLKKEKNQNITNAAIVGVFWSTVSISRQQFLGHYIILPVEPK